MFEEPPFKFLIGPHEKVFFVEGSLVAKTSPVFERLIGGPMKESHERVAKLPEVEPDTFQNFLLHTFTFGRAVNQTDKLHEGRLPYSGIVGLMLRDGQESFRCKQCGTASTLAFSTSFPFCQQCRSKRPPLANRCDNCVMSYCNDSAEYLQGPLCKECQDMLIIAVHPGPKSTPSDLADFQLAPLRGIKKLQSFHFDIPLRAKELAQFMRETNGNMHLPCANLMDIVKLALFADLYDASQLFEATVLAFYEQLAAFDCSGGKAKKYVLELASIVYQNTLEVQTHDIKEINILRRLVSDYLVTHLNDLLIADQMAAFSNLRREIFRDMILILSTRV